MRRCRGCCRAPAAGADSPRPVPPGFPTTTAAGRYSGPLRGALLAHKEQGRLALAAPLGRALAAAVRLLEPGAPVLLVPVPSDPRTVRRRGHDATRRLAQAAAGELQRNGLPARVSPLLVHGRRVADQAGLDHLGRQANLSGAVRVRRSVTGVAVVLVDDVVTTGASLTEAARALSAAGAYVLGAATVAATARRGT